MRHLHRTNSLVLAALAVLAVASASGRATAQFARRGTVGRTRPQAPVTRVVPAAPPLYQRDGTVANQQVQHVVGLGDINRDGTPDFAVGASAGRGYVLLCSGVDGAVLRQIDGEATGDQFGVIAPAGDFNRDGLPDILVGAPFHASSGRTDSGKIYVYSGDLNDTTPLLLQVDGPVAGENMGTSVAAAGDVDGNGQLDILTGAPGATVSSAANTGRIYLWNGSNGAELRHWDGETGGDRFGSVVASAGDANRNAVIDFDVDGNGRSDFIATAPFFDATGPTRVDAGRVYVFRSLGVGPNNFSTPDVFDGLNAGDFAGTSASSVGDLNGDNRSDVLVGAPGVGATDRGALYVFSGSLGTVLYSIPGAPLVANGDALGTSVAGVGDANFDGTPDFMSGIPSRNSSAGGALVFSGWDGSLLVAFNGVGANLRYGAEVAGAGDVNGDGRTDLLISQPGADSQGPAPLAQAGTVHVQYVPNQAPIAQDDNYTIDEDQPLLVALPGVLGNDSDPDRNPITSVIFSFPQHGAVTLQPNGAFDYTPSPNYFGSDSFRYRAFDGVDYSAPATVQITINSVNDLPAAQDQSLVTPEDTAIPVTLSAPDVEGDPVVYTVLTNPAHGTLSGSAPDLIYTPAPNYNGLDSFTFRGSDPFGPGPTATVGISITPVNDAPVVLVNQNLSVIEDTPKALNLDGTDPEASPLFYTIVTPPQHGTLSGGPGRGRIYTPALNYNGPDSFQYTVDDGSLTSALATVHITISAVNDAPVANPLSVSTPYQTPVNITLTGSDVEGSPITFTVISTPAHGTLTGSGAARTYTPANLFFGQDTFTFKVHDGSLDSAAATVTITVQPPPNVAPTANGQAVTTTEDTQKAITLQATDPDSSPFPLTYQIVTVPAHGTLSGTGKDRIYTPASDFNGMDSFTFRVNDGLADSNTATVTVMVTPVNDPPIATGGTVTTPEDTPLNLVLNGFDVDGDALTYTIINPPVNGTLSGTGANRVYTPAAEYNGSDSLTFQVDDGVTASAVVTVTIIIPAVNDRPVAATLNVVAKHFRATSITLRATDVDGPNLPVFTLVSAPQNGVLSGSGPNRSYLPKSTFTGTDSFTYVANDGIDSSLVATVFINVTENQTPVANAGVDQNVETTGFLTAVTLDGTASADPDGDSLSYTWKEGGTLLANGPTANVQLTLGTHTVTLTVADSDGLTSTDTVLIRVRDSVAPVLSLPASFSVAQDSARGARVTFEVSATDLAPGVTITSTPASGSLFLVGTTTVRCTARDSSGNSATGTFTVTVIPATSTGGKVKGSGTVTIGRSKAKFSINVQSGVGTAPSGKVTFQDPATRRKFASVSLTALVIEGSVARVYGTLTVNGANPVAFVAVAEDLGKKGKVDRFRLELSTNESFGPGPVTGSIKVTP